MPALHDGLSDTRLLLVATAAVLAEVAVRGVAALAVGPVAAVVVPPVAAVRLLGGHASRGATDDDPSPERLGRLAAVAVVGHAGALSLGVAAFLLLDTPVRAALYVLGRGDLLGPGVQLLVPLPAVAVGTVLGWTVPALAVAGVAAGDGLRTAGTRALATVVARPRSLARLAAALTGLAGWLAASGAVALTWGVAFRTPALGLAVGGTLAACGAVGALAVGSEVARAAPTASWGRAAESRSLARVALTVLLVSGLVVGTASVRTADYRSVDSHPEPLPDDPDAAYATALANTEAASHEYRVAVEDGGEEPFVVTRRIDRADRQYRSWTAGEALGPDVYASTGTGSPPRRGGDLFTLGRRTVGPDDRPVRAAPDYLFWAEGYDWEGGLTPPAPVAGWRVAERSEGRLVLVLDDPEAVFAALHGHEPGRLENVTAARVRAVVDRERGTLVRVETRLDVTVVEGGERYEVSGRTTHTFEVGVDVDRPAELGAPSLGERLWSVAAY